MTNRELIAWVAGAEDADLDFAFDLIKRERAQRSKASLSIGSLVSFDARSRGIQQGEVIKINRKTVRVDVDGSMWKCSPELLTVVG